MAASKAQRWQMEQDENARIVAALKKLRRNGLVEIGESGRSTLVWACAPRVEGRVCAVGSTLRIALERCVKEVGK